MLTSFTQLRSYLYKRLRGPRAMARQRGFTLIELMVVSAIMLLFTAFVIFQQTKFDSATLLRSLSYSVALTVRQAQVYGTSVRESSAGTGTFAQGYGVYFSKTLACPLAGSDAGSCYYLFADNDSGADYDAGAGEALPVYSMSRGYTVSQLCTRIGSATLDCSPGSFTIYFKRPNPEACIALGVGGACATSGSAYSAAYVVLSSGSSASRAIKVTNTGQISVCAPNLADLTTC